MDIFTTQLARLVPVRIKPEKLKVKALAKDGGVGKLSEEHDPHLKDEVDVYIQSHQSEQSSSEVEEQSHQSQQQVELEEGDKPKTSRLDLFV